MTAYDCQACGACCVSWDMVPDYVVVSTLDYNRMSPPARQHVQKISVDGARLRVMKLGFLPVLQPATPNAEVLACAALEGDVGGRCACTIYEERPKPCVRMEPGNEYCLHVRGLLGLELTGDDLAG